MIKAEYKNAIQTKIKISSTYLALCIEKKGKFSVTDVVEKAKINRGTFYLHFKNLKEVEKYIDDGLATRFHPMEIDFRQTDLSMTPEIILNKLNEILSKDLEYFKLVINASENSNLMDRIKASILESISNNFQIIKYVSNYEKFKIVVQYIVGGVLDAYIDWFKGNIKCSLDEMSSFLAILIKNGVRGYITRAY